MYFNENKEDTNIDNQFETKKEFNFQEHKVPILIGLGVLLLLIIIVVVLLLGNKQKYFIKLYNEREITIYQGTVYNEPGYYGYDKKKHDVTDKVKVSGEVDVNTIGTYTITYSLDKTKTTRTINVVARPAVVTYIHLVGDVNMTIKSGTRYEEPGYSAVDAIDGDITDKVTISGTVDITKPGTYRIVYSVINSEGVTTSTIRTVTVE